MKDYTSIDQATVHVLVLDLTDEQEKQLVTTLNAELNRRLTSDIMTLLNDDGLVRELGDLIKKKIQRQRISGSLPIFQRFKNWRRITIISCSVILLEIPLSF